MKKFFPSGEKIYFARREIFLCRVPKRKIFSKNAVIIKSRKIENRVITVIRLDKFLKLSQLVKRRAVAQEMIEVGAVRVNGRKVKSSADVKKGDLIEVAFPRRVISATVLIDDEALLRRRGTIACELRGERRVEPEEDPWS